MSKIECSSKYDWYQTETTIAITILRKGISQTECCHNYSEGHLLININDSPLFSAQLYGPIDPSNIIIICTPSKVEVRLNKESAERWPTLQLQSSAEQTDKATSTTTKNWDRLGNEAEKEVAAEEESSVDKLFQKIYKDADDDTRRAMLKSYSESCGTVLSTNWGDIKKQKTEVKPPDDMEYRKYDS